jgi:hypothetical protein
MTTVAELFPEGYFESIDEENVPDLEKYISQYEYHGKAKYFPRKFDLTDKQNLRTFINYIIFIINDGDANTQRIEKAIVQNNDINVIKMYDYVCDYLGEGYGNNYLGYRLLCAAEFGNLNTFLYCLWCYMNHSYGDERQDIQYKDLKSAASKSNNRQVINVVNALEQLTTDGVLLEIYNDFEYTEALKNEEEEEELLINNYPKLVDNYREALEK